MARSEVEVAPRAGAPEAAPGGARPRAAPAVGRVASVVVGFSTPRRWNLVSAGIRWATGSRASHAWLRVRDPLFDREMVIEAHASGMRLIPFSLFCRENRVIAIAYPSCDLGRGVAAAGAWLGRRFDFEGLLGMLPVLVGRWLGHDWKNLFHGSTALFCSEAVVMTLQEAGFCRAETLTADDTSPEDLLEFLQGEPACCRVVFREGIPTSPTRRRRRRAARRRAASDVAPRPDA